VQQLKSINTVSEAKRKVSPEKLRRLQEVRQNYTASMGQLIKELEEVEKARDTEELKSLKREKEAT
jgi:hypothetical protein